METAIYRTAILAFTACLVWIFKAPEYLVFLLLLLFTLKKIERNDVLQEVELVHKRIDNLINTKGKPQND